MRVVYSLLFFGSVFFTLEGMIPIGIPLPIHEAFAPKFKDSRSPTVATKSPPSPLTENPPEQPNSDLVWIPGYWAWLIETNDFKWICGVWRRPPPKHKWIPGKWSNNGGNWTWEQGFWSPKSIENMPKFQKTPPISIEDKIPTSPGDDHFWVPGFWAFSYDSQDYVWFSGKWEPFHDGWVLSPASYIWRPSGYIFVPMYWDWSLTDRGAAYLCDAYNSPQRIENKNIVHHLYSSYPDYLTLYWHCWHFHPNWWDGCNCIPNWWLWRDWWTFTWNNMWGCFWWWTHPGSKPPAFITYDISTAIAPPSYPVLDLFAYLPRPPFVVKEGSQPLDPLNQNGTFEGKIIPKPEIASDIKPFGIIKLPPFPVKQGAQISFSESPKEHHSDLNNGGNQFYNDAGHPPGQSSYEPYSMPNSSYYPGDTTSYNSKYSDQPNPQYSYHVGDRNIHSNTRVQRESGWNSISQGSSWPPTASTAPQYEVYPVRYPQGSTPQSIGKPTRN